MFLPTEIIFASTTACNLHCEHCFVSRTPQRLDIEQAKKFILSCKNSPQSQIEKIGFTGGEPFLYLDFLLEIIQFAVSQDFLFDQIMTNGDWWQTQEDLRTTLQKVYDAGYDGKFGLSWDNFHAQTEPRMQIFIRTVQDIFGADSINVQTVLQAGEVSPSLQKAKLSSATPSAGSNAARNACLQNLSVPQFILPQTFPGTDPRAWNSRHWFKEDYCQGPGNIFYIHSDGNIAPCCGFANENSKLFIGTINDTFEQVMSNASQNELVNICFNTGLKKNRRNLKKLLSYQGKKFPGKCNDICSFCDFVCKSL